MLDGTCRLRRVEVNAAALDALDPAPPAPRPLRAEFSARALDADDPAPAAAPAGGRRLDDLHAQQLAAVYAAAVYAAAGRQQLSEGGAAADNIVALGSHAVVLVEVRMPAEALYDARPPLRR